MDGLGDTESSDLAGQYGNGAPVPTKIEQPLGLPMVQGLPPGALTVHKQPAVVARASSMDKEEVLRVLGRVLVLPVIDGKCKCSVYHACPD